MRFLHTADWHLGKYFFEESMLGDQVHFLGELKDCIQKAYDEGAPYDALIVSGDIYDRHIPPSEAVTVFSRFITELRNNFDSLQLIFISGNHDSAERLSFLKEVLSAQNIHICTDCSSLEPIVIKNTAIYRLPFLTAGCIKKSGAQNFDAPLRTQQELLQEAVARISELHQKKYSGLHSVLSAHLFAAGSSFSDSEHSAVGTADQVSSSLLDFFDYTALGHIHSFQKVGKSAYYSGSPLNYSFGEISKEKYILDVSIDETVEIKKIAVNPLHPCSVIEGSFEELCTSREFDSIKNNYIQAVCTDKITIASPMSQLRKIFPNILSFTYRRSGENAGQGNSIEERRRIIKETSRNSPEKIFESFMADIYGTEQKDSSAEEAKLFAELFKKIESSGMENSGSKNSGEEI